MAKTPYLETEALVQVLESDDDDEVLAWLEEHLNESEHNRLMGASKRLGRLLWYNIKHVFNAPVNIRK